MRALTTYRGALECSDGISAALYDLDNARAVLRGVIAGKTPCKRPRAMVIEYIESARDALKEAHAAAGLLPEKGGDL